MVQNEQAVNISCSAFYQTVNSKIHPKATPEDKMLIVALF